MQFDRVCRVEYIMPPIEAAIEGEHYHDIVCSLFAPAIRVAFEEWDGDANGVYAELHQRLVNMIELRREIWEKGKNSKARKANKQKGAHDAGDDSRWN